jgi:hypothetical protein
MMQCWRWRPSRRSSPASGCHPSGVRVPCSWAGADGRSPGQAPASGDAARGQQHAGVPLTTSLPDMAALTLAGDLHDLAVAQRSAACSPRIAACSDRPSACPAVTTLPYGMKAGPAVTGTPASPPGIMGMLRQERSCHGASRHRGRRAGSHRTRLAIPTTATSVHQAGAASTSRQASTSPSSSVARLEQSCRGSFGALPTKPWMPDAGLTLHDRWNQSRHETSCQPSAGYSSLAGLGEGSRYDLDHHSLADPWRRGRGWPQDRGCHAAR